eukprot:GHVS01040970.1.p4 GENE.GHVS01040970.1~~GHVS01040970.1.p4  ORF type:complete len:103 (-),score=6.72 GHVS01040970.1:210-518(-)
MYTCACVTGGGFRQSEVPVNHPRQIRKIQTQMELYIGPFASIPFSSCSLPHFISGFFPGDTGVLQQQPDRLCKSSYFPISEFQHLPSLPLYFSPKYTALFVT